MRAASSIPAPPLLIAVGGLSGTGKSVLARTLAPDIGPAPGAVVLRSDVERKTLFGKDEHDKLPAEAYSPDVTARVYAAIADKARRAVAAGHSAIVDAVFARPQERAVMEQSAAGARRSVSRALPRCRSRHPRSPAWARAAATPPTPTRRWPRSQESYDLGALDWTRDRRLRHAGGDARPRKGSDEDGWQARQCRASALD